MEYLNFSFPNRSQLLDKWHRFYLQDELPIQRIQLCQIWIKGHVWLRPEFRAQILSNLVKKTDVNTDDFELGVEFTRWKTVRRGFMNCTYVDHTLQKCQWQSGVKENLTWSYISDIFSNRLRNKFWPRLRKK